MKNIRFLILFVTIASVAFGQVENDVVYEDFGSGLPGTWTVVNNGVSNQTWTADNGAMAISPDPDAGDFQDEWIITNDYDLEDDLLYTSYKISFDWVSGTNNNAPDNADLDIEYSFNGGASYGGSLWLSGEDGAYTHNGVDTNSTVINLAPVGTFNGQTVTFRISFVSTTIPADTFRLENFRLIKVFTPAAAPSTLPDPGTGFASIVYPPDTYYGAGQPEGFQVVAPNNWALTTYDDTTWERKNNLAGDPHYTYYSHVEGSDSLGEEIMITEDITINYPPQGSDYFMSFDWRSEFTKNCGGNTDPILGDVDFADAEITISTYNGSVWSSVTILWEEDDQDLLSATTTDVGYNWPYSDATWYSALIDISSYVTSSVQAIKIEFKYTDTDTGLDISDNDVFGGYLDIDNFAIWEDPYDEFDFDPTQPFTVSNSFLHNYSFVPITQINNPYQLGALITNNGIATFSDDKLFAYVNDGGGEELFGYKTVTDGAFSSYPSTEYFVIDNLSVDYIGGLNFTVFTNYTLRYQIGDINGSAFNESTTVYIDDNIFRKYTGGLNGYIGSDDVSGGTGSLFEFTNDDVINSIDVYLGDINVGSEFNMSIIELTNPGDASGTLVYSSPLMYLNADFSTYTFNEDIEIDAGYYVFMFNQLDDFDLNIAYHGTDGYVIRGNPGNLYSENDEPGNIRMNIYVNTNTVPVIETAFTGDEKVVVANDALSFDFDASDDDNDALIWTMTNASPSWLTDWITFTDNGDGTATLTGTPTNAHLGTSSITVEVDDNRGGTDTYTFSIEVMTQIANILPNYTEDFNDNYVPINWSILKDQEEDGTNQFWTIDVGNDWMEIFDDNGDKQNEWFISPAIYLAEDGDSDTTYTLLFDWYVEDFDDFCKGINGVLGSGTNNDGNFADVKVWISTDKGITWSDLIWQEDDPDLVASVTDGILGGDRWGYSDATWYTSEIDLTADYAGQTIMVAFQYLTEILTYNNNFQLDNFEILMNDEVDISVVAYTKYTDLPESQVDLVNGYNFGAYFINNGQLVPGGATYTVQIPGVGFYSTVSIDNSFFATGDVQFVEFNFMPEAYSINNYSFTITIDAAGNTSTSTSDSEILDIDDDFYYRDNSNLVSENSFGYYDGLGAIYEFVNAEHLEEVDFYSPTINNAPYSVSIIKINDINDTSGELIAVIDDNNGNPLIVDNNWEYTFIISDKDFSTDLYLEPGLYLFMVNQLDDALPVYISRSNDTDDFGDFVRGNFSNIYRDPYDKGDLYLFLEIEDNATPFFIDKYGTGMSALTVEVLEGQSSDFMIFADDLDEFDNLGFVQVTVPSFMAPAWLSFNNTGENEATMTVANTATAGTYPAQLMVGDGVDTATLDITITIVGTQFMADEFYEPFNGWTENYPEVVTADETWYLESGPTSETTNNWYRPGTYTRISSDANNYQDEWLISPYVYFSTPSNDTTYWLHFSWLVNDISVMLGGTQGTLGSGNEFDDYNYADLRVGVSTDGGQTWTTIWQEDDEALVLAASPNIAYPYNNNTYYDASIDITAYASQSLLFGFQYEGIGGSYIFLDDIEVERIDPYVDLEIIGYDPVAYSYVPLTQTKAYDVKAMIVNHGSGVSEQTTLSTEVQFGGVSLVPSYEESATVPIINPGDTAIVTFSQLVPDQFNNSYTIIFNSDNPYSLSQSYSFYVDDEFYYYPNGTNNGTVTNQQVGEGLGQIFEITNPDVLTFVQFETGDATGTDYLIKIIELTSEDATSGTLVYTSNELNKPGASINFYTYDIDDVYLQAGFYAIMLHPAIQGGAFNIYYDIGTDASFIRGNASGFAVDENNEAYLNLRLQFTNQTPGFVAETVTDDDAVVGIPFIKTVRVIDNDEFDVISINSSELPTWITLTDNGNRTATLSGSATVDDVGGNTIIITATDGTVTISETIVITVEDNPPPVFTSTPVQSADQGNVYSYTATAMDEYGDTVTLSATILPTWLTATLGGSGDTLVVTGTPAAGDIGNNTVSLLVTDEFGITSNQIYNIYVFPNNTPEFISNAPQNALEGEVYIYNIVTLDDNPDDVLTISGSTIPAWLTLSDNGDGTAVLTGTPASGNVGNNDVTITVTDNNSASSDQAFTINVIAANNAPAFTSTAGTSATSGQLYSYNVTASDADNNPIYFEANTLPGWMVLTTTGNGTATLSGLPTDEDVGSNSVVLTVSDGELSASQSFSITVAGALNSSIIVTTTAIENAEVDTEYLYNIKVTGENTNAVYFVPGFIPEWLSLTDNGDGDALLHGIPGMNFIGENQISIMVTDGNISTDHDFEIFVVENANESASGVEDGNISDFIFYPNPAKGVINVRNAEESTIYIYDIFGRLYLQKYVSSDDNSIDVTALSEGTFFVKIVRESKVETRRISILK